MISKEYSTTLDKNIAFKVTSEPILSNSEEPEWKRRVGKRGRHSRKDGWKSSDELSTDLGWDKIANERLMT